MKIKNLEIKNFSALAPMAGVANKAMREICLNYGAGFTVSELISSKGLSLKDKNSLSMISVCDSERPFGIQLFGNDPLTMSRATIEVLTSNPDFIDINMGCPAPKVIREKSGAFLHKNPVLAAKIAKEIVKITDLPVTAKIRSGFDKDNINAIEMAQRLEEAGVSAITVHARTKDQMYSGESDLSVISDVKKAVSIPVIGNGDIFDGITAAKMFEQTGCDMVMVGRGAMGRPWVFQQIEAFMKHQKVISDPPISERMRVMIMHIELLIKYKGEYIGIREARRHASYYIKGIHDAAEYRRKIFTIENLNEIIEIASEIIEKEEKVNA